VNRVEKVCSEIMNYLVEQGFTNQVDINQVRKVIIRLRGPDKRTINNWLKALETLGYLKPESAVIYSMNLASCPELFVKALRGEKQKKLM